MLFLPIKAAFALPRFPALTLLVCIICGVVFAKQLDDAQEFDKSIARYCELDRSRLEIMVFNRIAEVQEYGHCAEMMYRVAMADEPDALVDEIVLELRPLVGFSAADSQEYVRQMLEDELRKFHNVVGSDPIDGLGYYTTSWNPWYMLTSAFAHADWGHIIFNLIFFFAFAATVEALMGPVAFVLAVIAISLFTGVFTSVSAYASGNHTWSLGLSGVVMGMMGLYTYLLPRGKIKCFWWVLVFFGWAFVPAWMLTLWYVGGDIWRLFAVEDHGFVNVMAHVTGGIAGYLFGVLFLGKAKQRARDLQFELDFDSGPSRV